MVPYLALIYRTRFKATKVSGTYSWLSRSSIRGQQNGRLGILVNAVHSCVSNPAMFGYRRAKRTVNVGDIRNGGQARSESDRYMGMRWFITIQVIAH